ncbi:MAG: hypothetical protein IJ011_03425 [Clostridia bacterium]|nr:hypothetical protein [Clostridia bacterium]
MDNEIYLNEKEQIGGFTDSPDTETLSAAFPALNENNLKFISSYYKGLGKCPTYGALKIFENVLTKRRKDADGALLSTLGCDSVALMETYGDLKAKYEALSGKKYKRMTLDEAARVSGDYLRMIGRYDALSKASAADTKPEADTLTVCAEGESVLAFGNKRDGALAKKLPKEKFAVILLDGENYENSARAFFSDRRARALCSGRARVGRFGIIGTLCALCAGARADLSRISEGTPESEILCNTHLGKYIVFTLPKNASAFCSLAELYGMTAIYFAVTETGGSLKTRTDEIPLELIKILADSRRELPTCVAECDLSASAAPLSVTAKRNGTVYDANEKLIKSDERLISALCISPEKNSFGSAVNAITDSILRLVAAGVDRRAICSAVSYSFQKNDVSPEALGEALSLILGVYRVCVELALSEGVTDVRYGERTALTSALYATAPRSDISAKFVKSGSRLVFLALGTGADGLVDFGALRRTCDSFTELCKKCKVLSASAVTTRISDSIEKMGGEFTAALSENGKLIADTPCRGILIETDDGSLSDVIGEVICRNAPDTAEA